MFCLIPTPIMIIIRFVQRTTITYWRLADLIKTANFVPTLLVFSYSTFMAK